jgi:integrase/recombinase XerC
MAEMPLPTEIAEFLVHLEKERDLSPNTLVAYTRDLREFSSWLAQTYGINGWDWNEITRTSVRGRALRGDSQESAGQRTHE